jgi:hypothetical protein
MNDATAPLQAIAWPVVVLVAVIVLRPALLDIARDLGRRVTKVSVFQVSLELATIPEFKTTWQIGLNDIRQPASADLFDTPATELFAQFVDENGFDYAVVDLGSGDEWVSSRLFVFAEMLPRLRGLRCFVFLETAGTTPRKLVGMARPEAVRWTLAQQYPWLEPALEHAYAKTGQEYYENSKRTDRGQATGQESVEQEPPTQVQWYRPVISLTGAVLAGSAQEIGRTFLSEIQENARGQSQVPQPSPPPSLTDPAQPILNCDHGWVPVPNTRPRLCEHGEWLNGDDIRRLLRANLQQDAWVKDDPRASEDEQVRAVLRRTGDFVAIVFEDRTFSRLVDRHLLLEESMARELRQQSA